MYLDLYKNHFLTLRCSRPTFLAFTRYTLTALENSPNPALKALGNQLRASLDALGGSVVERQQLQGRGQGQTRTRRELIAVMRQFVRDLHAEVLVPKYRKTPSQLDALLPQGLTAFNEAKNDEVPVLFEALRDGLAERTADLTTQPEQDASKLLAELTEATRLKNEGDKQKRETIADIGAQWKAVCDNLWEAHCLALAAFFQAPDQARAYFNYHLLPTRNPQRQQVPAPKNLGEPLTE